MVQVRLDFFFFFFSFLLFPLPTLIHLLLRCYLSCSETITRGKLGEAFYHGFWLASLLDLQRTYVVSHEDDVGEGRLDVCLIPKSPSKAGVILEFGTVMREPKKESTIKKNLNQLALAKLKQAEGYVPKLFGHCSSALLYGLVFYKASVVVEMKTVQVKG